MRLFGTLIVICMLALGADATKAQGICPFLAFCTAQQAHCNRNCAALTDVIDWSHRPSFVQRCSYGCDVQYSRCTMRQLRNCSGGPEWR